MSLSLALYILIPLCTIMGCGFILCFKQRTRTGGVEQLSSEFKSSEDEPKPFFEMSKSERIESHKEYLRIANDHSEQKKYIRFCVDELTQYPSGYILTLKESDPLPDYSEKGMDEIPSFGELCAKIKDLAKLDDCVYIDPKICELPFFPTGLEGNQCFPFAEICDGNQEPYVSFWLKRFIPKDAYV